MLQVRLFPCLNDNYGFLAHDPSTGETACIDTPDADAILRGAETAGWRISQVWNTHHHWDHAGGNQAVKAATGAFVVAPADEKGRIDGVDRAVADGETVRLGDSRAEVIATPGHTLGHVIYHFPEEKIAFVGDTLFALGCGRLFEGDPEQMWASLKRVRALPKDTTLYCAHEYTQANARFALTVEPDNEALQAYAAEVDDKRARGEPTVPTRLDAELAANPFLRADKAPLKKALGMARAAPEAVFAEVRGRKDRF